MKKPAHLLKRHLKSILLLFVVLCSHGYSQSPELNYNQKEINACTKYRRDPFQLVSELTKNKSGDKEKFDAIFAWVALNIKYDFRKYYSESGSPEPDLYYVLKKKKGICIDYARLMDTLCAIAGVKNYTVLGYAKDELFDVGDPFYSDNHAWNAVRLDNEWYLYDVTWAASQKVIELNRFGRFLERLISKWPIKTKKKTIKNKYIKECKKYCPPESYEKIPREFVFKSQRYRFPVILSLTALVSTPFVFKYKHRLDTGFYLCQPEVFALTHYPDHPAWTLLQDKTIKDFSSDSAYYYMTKKNYEEQTRYGVSCAKCDSIVLYSYVDVNKDLITNSLKSNPNNRFVTSGSEFIIGRIKFLEAMDANDSLAKMKLIDTALIYFQNTKRSLKLARKNADAESTFQKRKNKKKSIIQFQDTKKQRLFFNGLTAKASGQAFNIKLTKRNMRIPRNKLRYRRKFLRQMKTDYKPLKPALEEAPANKIKAKIAKAQQDKDGLNIDINKLKAELGFQLPDVADSVKEKLADYFIFMSPYEQKVKLRMKFYDDYKKEIIDKKKYIEQSKAVFKTDLDTGVFKLIIDIIAEVKELRTKIDKRNELNKIIEAENVKLVRGGAEPVTPLEELKRLLNEENTDDLCWFIAYRYFADLESYGFSQLAEKLKSPDRLFRQEYLVEKRRYRYVDKWIDHKRRTHKNIIEGNNELNRKQIKALRKWKKKLLKEYKDSIK